MKFSPLFAVASLVFSSCAPMAILIAENDQSSKPKSTEKQPTGSPVADDLPDFKPNDGLLDPSRLSAMPSDRDMKPTVDPADGNKSTIIANPPGAEKPTSE